MILKIAEHRLRLTIPEEHIDLTRDYRPFVCDDADDAKVLFEVIVVAELPYEVRRTLVENIEMSDSRMVRVNIYETTQGMLYRVIMPGSPVVNGELHVVGDRAFVRLESDQREFFRYGAFTNAMLLSYITYTLPHDTLLLHASAILKDGSAHLFLGKSGTGKSTHSRMWLESFADAELLNDDHPVVRRHANGEVVAYGSPWSGKTPCYRNLSAPLRAIVRIKRADHNALKRLSTIRSYASITSSCSGAQWSTPLAEARRVCLERLITSVGFYEMECLPEPEAALCCYETLCAERL